MKIITGETAPTKGQVKIGGFNVTNNQSDAYKMLGYCPQVKLCDLFIFNSLFFFMTTA
jgi:ABC-type multidrug transport system ATPase subunit